MGGALLRPSTEALIIDKCPITAFGVLEVKLEEEITNKKYFIHFVKYLQTKKNKSSLQKYLFSIMYVCLHVTAMCLSV